MIFVNHALDRLGGFIAHLLSRPSKGYQPLAPSDAETLERVMQPGDVLLIEGNEKLSVGIKYLTQSTWSHAAIYIGDALDRRDAEGRRLTLIEVNLTDGCVAAPLEKYEYQNTRVCRPVGLTREDRNKVVQFMIERLGLKYDMRNVFDLARYLLPTPPVPMRWRRRMIALGSGQPSRAICSTLIAQAFQSVKYPILPRIERLGGRRQNGRCLRPARDPAHPPPFAVHAARFRSLALFQDRQALSRTRLRLQADRMGGRRGRRTGRARRHRARGRSRCRRAGGRSRARRGAGLT